MIGAKELYLGFTSQGSVLRNKHHKNSKLYLLNLIWFSGQFSQNVVTRNYSVRRHNSKTSKYMQSNIADQNITLITKQKNDYTMETTKVQIFPGFPDPCSKPAFYENQVYCAIWITLWEQLVLQAVCFKYVSPSALWSGKSPSGKWTQ